MLSLRVIGLRDVPRPQPETLEGNTTTTTTSASWAVQVTHGSQQCQEHFMTLPSQEKGLQGHTVAISMKNGGDEGPHPTQRNFSTEEIDIQDTEDDQTVNIALLCNSTPITMWKRKLSLHSSTTIDMRDFRAQPEKRVVLWQPLRPASPAVLGDYGAIQLTAMYTHDCVADGYRFGLFCGLAPSLGGSYSGCIS